ncbi:MAG: Rrf2 family transcriptional regulator [Planctomycetota bacterium]
MLRITRKADYAIFLLTSLARKAEQDGVGELTTANQLSDSSTLNKSMVANLLKDLHKARLIDSVRGKHGGYRLARDASDIHLAEILEAVEGPFAFVECATDAPQRTQDAEGNLLPGACGLSDLCTSKGVLRVLNLRIRGMFEEVKLSELADTSRLSCASSTATTSARVEFGSVTATTESALASTRDGAEDASGRNGTD